MIIHTQIIICTHSYIHIHTHPHTQHTTIPHLKVTCKILRRIMYNKCYYSIMINFNCLYLLDRLMKWRELNAGANEEYKIALTYATYHKLEIRISQERVCRLIMAKNRQGMSIAAEVAVSLAITRHASKMKNNYSHGNYIHDLFCRMASRSRQIATDWKDVRVFRAILLRDSEVGTPHRGIPDYL